MAYLSTEMCAELSEEMLHVTQRAKFEEFLKSLKETLDGRPSYTHPSCFISYAQEPARDEHTKQKSWLQSLRDDLRTLGMRVFIDLGDISGDKTRWIQESIRDANYILLIGTPLFKERASISAANLEWRTIQAKCKSNPDILIPVLYKGDPSAAFPASALERSPLDCRDSKQYYVSLTSLAPRGLIPVLYKFYDDAAHKFYTTAQKALRFELQEIEREFKEADAKTEQKTQEKTEAEDIVAKVLAGKMDLDEALTDTSGGSMASAPKASATPSTTRYSAELPTDTMDALDGLFALAAPSEPFNTCLYRSVIADRDLGTKPPLYSEFCKLPAPDPHFYDNTMHIAFDRARDVAQNHPDDPLVKLLPLAKALDYIASIHIYTQEATPREYSIYFIVNQLMNSKQRGRVQHWRDYIY
jgi:hypothetical protein